MKNLIWYEICPKCERHTFHDIKIRVVIMQEENFLRKKNLFKLDNEKAKKKSENIARQFSALI